jgi:hypothetical protein
MNNREPPLPIVEDHGCAVSPNKAESTARTPRQLVEAIIKAYARSQAGARQMVEGIIKTGNALIEAKDNLPHGYWGVIFKSDKMPLSQNMAEALMKIAAHEVLSKSEHVQNLPPSWGTLRELAKLDDAALEKAIKTGAVHPLMLRKEAVALRPQKPRGSKVQVDKPATPHDDLASELQDALDMIERLEAENERLRESKADALDKIERLRESNANIEVLINRLVLQKKHWNIENRLEFAAKICTTLNISASAYLHRLMTLISEPPGLPYPNNRMN